jgi:putative salt-induced outer membrane protein YdiY
MSRRYRAAFALILFGFLYLLAPRPSYAAVKRHDTIIMKNGDHLTGEVKRLQEGVLYVQTDYFSGSVGLDWLQVEKVESTATFQIVLSDGKRLTGHISKSDATPNKEVMVSAQGVEIPLASTDVVEIQSQKPNFWRQLKGSINLGYNYTSGNNQSSLSSSADAEYVAARWAAGANYTTSLSGQTGGASTNLFQQQSFGERFLNRNSYVIALADFLHSSQQDLSLRTTLGGAYGRYLVRNNQNSLRWLVGADYTLAKYDADLGLATQKDTELLLGVEYQLFHFDRYTLQSQFLVFPGISDFGRVRFTTTDTFGIKLSNNFSLNFSFWDNFDSHPPLNAKQNAQGISTSLGWTF